MLTIRRALINRSQFLGLGNDCLIDIQVCLMFLRYFTGNNSESRTGRLLDVSVYYFSCVHLNIECFSPSKTQQIYASFLKLVFLYRVN